MFEVDSVKTPGLSIQEAVRNIHVHRFVNRTLESSDRVDEEIEAGSGKDSVLRARGTVLRDENGGKVGALIVFTDITDLRRLENIRREFVANVSHELKTPITAIKGFVETLQGGAIADKEEAEKFLKIIARHADRLDAIIDDLLSLSKIEQAGDKEDIKFENAELGQVIKSSIKSLEMKAREKNIGIKFDCPADLRPSINASLIEQAITNLLDNAINYSDPGNDVEVKATKTESNIIIAVRDHGCGIEKRHLPRLFERFYRVDTARSRKMGGTGLGLAIVKHIAQIHGGYATVESEPGKGSLFSLNLPYR
jgi:two-component system phosphate regulon sensor histidine kinase PhoR